MAFCDFVVKYDPEKDTALELTKRILYSVIVKRLKHKKPAVIFCSGDSGEGKSLSMLRLQMLLLEIQGQELDPYVEVINVFTPLQYPEKLNRLLYDKELKKINLICIHEAREVVKAKNWASFLNQAIADVNAMSRSVKRLCFMIVSQFIRDISTDIRYTINFYCKVIRPKGKPARLYINVLWKDDRDLEKPRLRKRKLSGYLVYPDGTYRRLVPSYFEMHLPPRDIIKRFEELDYNAKSGIIKRKLNKLINEMKLDAGEENNKIKAMVEWYLSNPQNVALLGRRVKGKFRIKKEVKELHNLTPLEVKEFEKSLYDGMNSKGYFKTEAQQEAQEDIEDLEDLSETGLIEDDI